MDELKEFEQHLTRCADFPRGHLDAGRVIVNHGPIDPPHDQTDHARYKMAWFIQGVGSDPNWRLLTWARLRELLDRASLDIEPEVDLDDVLGDDVELLLDREVDDRGRPPPSAPIADTIVANAPPVRALTLPTREERAA